MTGEKAAPAEMPGEEEIAKLISGAPFPSTKSLSKARAVVDLFAPILAEKQKPTVALNHWKSRALAAEAALAAERERADMAVQQMIKQNDRLEALRDEDQT